MVQITAKLPPELVQQLDKYAEAQSSPIRQVTRTDAVRFLLTEALKSEAVKPAGAAQ